MSKKLIVSVLVLSLTLLAAVGVAQAKTLKLAHIYPPDHPFQTVCLMIAKDVADQTDGALEVKVYPAGQLGSEKDIVEGVVTGSVDMVIAGPGELGKWYNKLLVFEAAYVFNNVDHMYRVIESEVGQELYQGLLDASGMRVLGTLYYGTRHVTTADTPVRKPEDLNGLKLRAPDMPQSVANAKAMGANPTPMAFAEVYQGLQQGVVDGQENPIATIASMKFYEVQDYLALTGHVVQATPIVISDQVFSSLTAEEQEILANAVKDHEETNVLLIEDYTERMLQVFRDNGMNIIEDVDVEAFRARVKEYLPEWEKKWGEGLYNKLQSVE